MDITVIKNILQQIRWQISITILWLMANKRFIIISEVPLSNKIYKDWFVGHLIKIFKSKFEFWIINKNIKQINTSLK